MKLELDLKLLVIDVDGTMTDGGIYYDEHGNELKRFCTKDAAGFFAAPKAGIKIMVLTGRECAATARRMGEMKVEHIFQNIGSKEVFLQNFMKEHGLSRENIGYIGDDLNDLPAMKLAGYIGCPADACPEVKEMADYIAARKGGHGAVRDVIEHMLRERGEWEKAVSEVYGIG